MTKSISLLFAFFIISNLVSAQKLLTLSNIEEIYNAPVNKKEIKILNQGFELGTIQPTKGMKLYVKNNPKIFTPEENISFVLRKTKYNDPVGNISYQTWVPKHYAKINEAISKKYKYIGNFKFTDSDNTYDLYQGNGFDIIIYSFISGGNEMVGNITFKPTT